MDKPNVIKHVGLSFHLSILTLVLTLEPAGCFNVKKVLIFPHLINHGMSLPDKLAIRDGKMWCLDVFDKFVLSGQSVHLGEAVVRRYRPVTEAGGAGREQRQIVLGVFAADTDEPEVKEFRRCCCCCCNYYYYYR